jgi:hypothetical protein
VPKVCQLVPSFAASFAATFPSCFSLFRFWLETNSFSLLKCRSPACRRIPNMRSIAPPSANCFCGMCIPGGLLITVVGERNDVRFQRRMKKKSSTGMWQWR